MTTSTTDGHRFAVPLTAETAARYARLDHGPRARPLHYSLGFDELVRATSLIDARIKVQGIVERSVCTGRPVRVRVDIPGYRGAFCRAANLRENADLFGRRARRLVWRKLRRRFGPLARFLVLPELRKLRRAHITRFPLIVDGCHSFSGGDRSLGFNGRFLTIDSVRDRPWCALRDDGTVRGSGKGIRPNWHASPRVPINILA